MDPETRAVLEAVQTFKKKAPRLNRNDRTLSLAVDNYLPGTSQHQQHQQQHSNVASGVTIDPNLLIDNNLMIPPSSLSHAVSSPIQEFRKSNIFYMDGSNHSLNNYPDFTHPHTHQMSRKPNIRRSDTLDVYGAYEMRKANSFNSNEMASDEMLMSRRTNSMRHTQGSNYPYEMDEIGSLPPPAPPIVTDTGNTRRNCRMHKSFHDRSRQHEIKMEKIVDAVKCHSLGDDGADDNNVIIGQKRRLSPKFNSAESSLDNEVFHSRSGSRNKIESVSIDAMDAIESATSPTNLAATKKVIATAVHKHSSQSLDKPHHSFRRIARATQSFYVNPVQNEEIRLQRTTMHGTPSMASVAKRMHSASMRTKPFREALAEAKKSKSFVNDPFGGGNAADYELSPRRRESINDIKKSPRLSTSTYDQKSSNYDGNDLDYDNVMHAYRQNRRKSSILSSGGGGGGGAGSKKKGSSKKKNTDGNEAGISDTDAEDRDTESTRKRKRIVCILVSLFLSLVFAGVFVVVFTFTYSSMTQVSDHTKRVYTFAPGPGNRDMPIHHHNGKYYPPPLNCTVFHFHTTSTNFN